VTSAFPVARGRTTPGPFRRLEAFVRRHLPRAVAGALALGAALAGCSSGASPHAQGRALPLHWVPYRHMTEVVDLAGPRADGSFLVAANGRLFTLTRAGAVTPFAQGPGGYSTKVGPEPYIAIPGNERPAGSRCSFSSGTVFALEPKLDPGIVEITQGGQARRFVSLPGAGLPDGIAFDTTGHFGHRLLVADATKATTTVLAIDCAGSVRTITTHAPVMEGGMMVAPASFGRYGGDLIGTNERTGVIFALAPDGRTTALAVSGLPHGGDIGVESAGFVPPGFGRGDSAYLADRYTKNNPHPGTDNILRLSGAGLVKAGARPGDLLVATEGSARTILVTCASVCTVKYIAIGPAVTHAEGHIVFTRAAG
jgi:hypothetical protein